MSVGSPAIEESVAPEDEVEAYESTTSGLLHRSDIAAGCVGLLAGMVPAANSWQPGFPVDDSYISFSYALHLSTGRGLRLSSFGHPVEAFSDPLWVFILAIGHLLGFRIPNLAMAIGLLLLGAIAAVTSGFVRYLAPRCPVVLAALPGLLFALLPASAFSVVAGLETLLFAFLLELGLFLWIADLDLRGRPSARAHLVFGLLALTRPEGALIWVGLVVATVVMTRTRRAMLRPALPFIVPVVGYELFRAVYFGQLTPNSVVAKSGYNTSTSFKLDRVEVLGFWHEYWPLLLTAGLLIAAFYGLPRQSRGMRIVGGVIVGLGLFESAVSSGDNYPYERYLLVGLPLVLTLVTAGSVLMTEARVRLSVDGVDGDTPGSHARSVIRFVGSAFLVLVLVATGLVAKSRENALQHGDLDLHGYTMSHLASMLRPDTLERHSGSTYHYALAGLLNAHGDPLIATDEIGIVSFYTHSKVIDIYGLGDSHISHLAGRPGDRPDPSYLFGHNPRYIVLLVGGCLCLGVPSDIAYASAPGLERYHIADILYDGNAGFHPWDPSSPGAVLFERSGPPGSVRPLDDAIPAALRITAFLPPSLKARLSSELPTDPASGVVAPPVDLEIAGAMALSSFVAVTPGTMATIPLPVPDGRDCAVEARAFSDDTRAAAAELSLSDTSAGQAPVTTVSVPASQISLIKLPLPTSAGPLVLRTKSSGNMVVGDLAVSCNA